MTHVEDHRRFQHRWSERRGTTPLISNDGQYLLAIAQMGVWYLGRNQSDLWSWLQKWLWGLHVLQNQGRQPWWEVWGERRSKVRHRRLRGSYQSSWSRYQSSPIDSIANLLLSSPQTNAFSDFPTSSGDRLCSQHFSKFLHLSNLLQGG